jgi:hypothetical protein
MKLDKMNMKIVICSLGAVALLVGAGCSGTAGHQNEGMGGTGAAYQGSSQITEHGDSPDFQPYDYRDTLSDPGPF